MDTVKNVPSYLEATTYYRLYISLSDGNTLPKVYPETTLLSVLYEEVEALMEMGGVSNVVLSQVVWDDGEKYYILGSWVQTPDRVYRFPKPDSHWLLEIDDQSGYEEVIVVEVISNGAGTNHLVEIHRASGFDFTPGKPTCIYELNDFMKKATPVVKLPKET